MERDYSREQGGRKCEECGAPVHFQTFPNLCDKHYHEFVELFNLKELKHIADRQEMARLLGVAQDELLPALVATLLQYNKMLKACRSVEALYVIDEDNPHRVFLPYRAATECVAALEDG